MGLLLVLKGIEWKKMQGSEYRTVQSGVSEFWARKYASEANKNWDKFYRRNGDNFFRDRHWTTAAATDGFPCLTEANAPSTSSSISASSTSTSKSTKSVTSAEPPVLVEAGCGAANSVWPLIINNEELRVYAFDFAPSAIELVRQREEYASAGGRVRAFVWDFCGAPLADAVVVAERGGLMAGVADFVTLIFVLSAVPPHLQETGMANLAQLLKPGGRLLFRDYATGDLAQTRFKSRNRIDDNYFVRQDRTLSYFFDEQHLHVLASHVGLTPLYIRRVHRVIENRKESLKMQRVFLQAEFQKP